MYKEFFGLAQPPFNLTPDPRFFYMSRRHQEALASLVYGVKERKGFILLTGEIGAGKTTLCRTFLNELNPEATNVALVLNSYLTDVELLQTINDELGLDSSFTSKKQLIDELNKFLLAEADKGKTTVIIIDEAQNLTPAVLEQVRMLSNLETETAKLIQIILMGQPELGQILERPELEQLNQRIMVRSHIGPLDKQEIYHYIRHRLQVAGARINVAVNAAALNRIYRYSSGIPRRINVLCDRALLAAYAAGQFWIDSKIIAAAESELQNLGIRRPKKLSQITFSIHPSVIFALFAGCLLIGGAVGAVWFAIHMDRYFPTPTAFGNALPAATRSSPLGSDEGPAVQKPGTLLHPKWRLPAGNNPASPPARQVTHPRSKIPNQKPAISNPSTSTMASALPPANVPPPPLSLAAISTSVTLEASKNWTYDTEGIARVSDPDFASMASLLTISKLWRIPVQLDGLRAYDKNTLLSINLQSVFNGPQMNLRSFETTATVRQAIQFDLPLVLEVEDTSNKLSCSIALLRVIGEKCVLGDPRLGRVELALPALEKLVRRIQIFYLDRDNLAIMLAGENSGKVARLRTFLADQGAWSGMATWVFDEDVKESLKRFQAKCQLPATGVLDGPTAARIAVRRQAFRPRLMQTSDAN